ncbi:MAG: hydantoinase/oxoprolinase family protein [Planctomycetes bacterium]|nr:hydantoinase/oxoprolinase family protein [Planctomycetota bacterium]
MMTVGIDAGGTFTDFVVFDGRTLRTHKVLSSRRDPAGAVAAGIAQLELPEDATLVHGTTIATNAFLERRGARVALVTTRGFEDLIEIGRQTRGALFDLEWEKPAPLVPRARRFGVDERIGPDGRVVRALDARALKRLPHDVDAIAICFLHSYRNPAHEERAARALKGRRLSVSSRIVPEYREYERLATTVLNAYVAPIMEEYLDGLPRRVCIMGSAGGQMSARDAAERPVHTLLSGPAGGAVALDALCRELGVERAIGLDMGGTSTDVSLFDGGVGVTKEGTLGGFPIRVPILEIHAVGAGGGSIARVDTAGALRVGPESAGAEPGPACYGRGGARPTVTDANVALGRIAPDLFFGGRLRLDVSAARRALGAIPAEAVVEVANAGMERAMRVVSVERGHDPEDFWLVAFGGAGPLHACDLAARMNLKGAIIPRWPGLFSALGMVLADQVIERSQSVLGVDVESAFRRLERGLPGRLDRFVDARYEGQSYELRVPWPMGDFHAAHRRRYGYARPEAPIEIVNAIVRSVVRTRKPAFERLARGTGRPRPVRRGCYERTRLRAGDRIDGPTIVMEDNATTYVARGWRARVDAVGSLWLTR